MNADVPNTDSSPGASVSEAPALLPLTLRSLLGGVMMGLANLVPGISGGTMLLAAGVYPRFIDAIGEVTTLTFRKRSLVVLGCVVLAALAAIVLFAGPVKEMVVHYRWIMYSLFIGLTLGGVPVVWRLIQSPTAAMWLGAVAGLAMMIGLAIAQSSSAGTADNSGFLFMLLAGIAGASAMILPGVSGGYLLLVLGVYVPILAAISQFKDALGARDFDVLMDVGFGVILPVGLGVVIGIVGVSNLLRWLLHRYEKATLGVLLGLLVGAVAGLWPFQQGVAPTPGDILKGQEVVTAQVVTSAAGFDGDIAEYETGLAYRESAKPVEADDYPTAFFQPSVGQIFGSIFIIVFGFGITQLVDWVGREKQTGC